MMKAIHDQRVSKTAIAIGSVFVAAGLFFSIAVWGAYWMDSNLERNGPRAEGHVIEKRTAFSADGDSDFIVEYWFDLPGGERVTTSKGVPRDLWESLNEGETFIVVYSADDPGRSFPLGGGVTSVSVSLFATGIAAVFFVFGALLLFGAFRRGSRDV